MKMSLRPRRYTILVADRGTGVVRRVTISLKAAGLVAGAIVVLPILIGLGARWSALAELQQLRHSKAALEVENGLTLVRHDVEQQEKLAAATPSISPAHGWLTGYFGGRPDPFTGEADFHQGLDISTEKGQPVYATADGVVESASYTGDYGNF